MNQGVGKVKLFIRILNDTLNENIIQNWNSELVFACQNICIIV